MPRRLIERRAVVIILSLLLLASGTPQALSRDAALDAYVAQALAARQDGPSDEAYASSGAPPDDDQYRALTAPTPSGANPPYPSNHTFDADQQLAGSPPSNHDFETAAYPVGSPPGNADLEAVSQLIGTPVTNHDFELGNLSGWTTGGAVALASNPTQGFYAELGLLETIVSDAFTVDAATQAIVVEIGFLTSSGSSSVIVYARSGSGYSTLTSLGALSCSACNAWETRTLDVSALRGQSIKLDFRRNAGTIGIDAPREAILFPQYSTSGAVSRLTESGGNTAARLDGGGTLITSAFSVTADAQSVTFSASGLTAGSDQFYAYVLSGPVFATQTQALINTNVPDSWTQQTVNASPWRGQTIKLKLVRQNGAVAVDNLGGQLVAIPGWELEADAWIVAGTPSGNAVSTNGDLTSAAFTIPADVQHLTLLHRIDPSASSGTFYVELLRGTGYSTVTDLAGYTTSASGWGTLKVTVSAYAGETVKLRVRHWFGRIQVDDAGLLETVLPGWTSTSHTAVGTGEDSQGSYVQALGGGSVVVRSAEIATGIIDSDAFVQQRYYAISYDIGYATSELVRVKWFNTTGQSWTVFQDAASSPTGYRTRYFWLADFMGTDGYFEVQAPKLGKVYSIADNVPRQHLNEPFSEAVGAQVDTSTGSFGYQSEDLATQGLIPLIFTRYYAAHSDQYGVLGYRWTHSYDTRLVFGEGQDVGVVLGSGRELFYDWYIVISDPPNRFVPADARVHETLVKNGDGSYTFTTTTRLDYHFTSAGVLTSITDPNGNSVTLTYDTGGRLTTVTDPVGRELDLTYDTNGRLASVTDPVGAAVSYGYDTNGDLTSVTNPASAVWTYGYAQHRLVEVRGPDDETVLANTLDAHDRVVTQTLADGATLEIDYATPSKGVTSVTDPEGNTAKFYFDAYARTNHKVDPLNRVTEFQYDGVGNRVRVIDPANNEWDFAYDGSGNLTTFTDATGNPLSIVYNAQHLPTLVTDPCDNQTTLTYDGNGNVASVTNELNETTSWSYNSRGQVLTETNDLNQTTTSAYDSQGNRTSLTDPLNQIWTWTYDGNGRVLTETDPLNYSTSYTYDFHGNLTKITDHLSNEIERLYDLYGYLLWEEDQLNQRTSWQYDERGNVVMKQDPAGKQWTYTWDGNGNMLTQTDPNQQTTTYVYDDTNRLISVANELNETTTRAYDSNGRLATITDPLNRTMTFGYDAAGRLVSTILPNGGVNTSTYDDCGNLLATTDALSHSTSYTYDSANRKLTLTDPRGKVWSYAYDGAGRLLTETNPLSGVTTYIYDAAGRQTAVSDPLSRTTTYDYDVAGNQTSVTDALSQTTTSSYDALNRLVSVTDALSQTTTYTYDAAGRRTVVTLPSGNDIDYVYDVRGLLLSVTDSLNHATTYTYDDAGRKITETDANNHTTSFGYDAADRQTTMTDALSGVVTMAYDAAGRMTSLTDPRGKTRTYTHSALGAVATETDPLNRTTTNTYDLAGRLTGTTDPRNVSITYAYDDANNLTGVTYPGGSVSHVYDDLGRRTSMTDATGTTTTSYDAASQVLSEAAPQGTVSYTYDDVGRRTRMTTPGSRWLDYAYDAANRLTSITDWQSQTTDYTYSVDGQQTSMSRPNGIDTSYGYDLAGRLTSLRHFEAASNTTLQQYNYTLDDVGNRTAVTGSITESYTLDALNRLTNAAYTNGDSAAYVYDASGNRTSQTITVGGIPDTTLFTYDDAGQLTQAGLTSYTYDLAGNLTAAGTETYAWDWSNQLTSATVGGATTGFTYDGDGIRVAETTNSVTIEQVWDRSGGLPTMVSNGATTYVHGSDGMVAEVSNAGVATYHHGDALGSTRGLTDGNGAITGTTEYGAFGEERGSTGATSQFGYTGEQTETTTGNTFLRARSYDTETGRFLSADTVQPNAPGTQGYNRYAYTANNPTTWTDPSGHSVSDSIALVDDLQGLVNNVVAFANAITPLLPAIMALGPFGFGIALFIFYKFLLLAVEILLGIALWLSLLIDDFQFYGGVNPTEDASDEHPDEQTDGPLDCNLTRDELIRETMDDLGIDSSEEVLLEQCGVSKDSAGQLVLLANWIQFVVAAAQIGWIAGMTLQGCLFYAYLSFALGCVMGFAQASAGAFVAGATVNLTAAAISTLLTCWDITTPARECGKSVAAAVLNALVSSHPVYGLLLGVMESCSDLGYLSVQKCISDSE